MKIAIVATVGILMCLPFVGAAQLPKNPAAPLVVAQPLADASHPDAPPPPPDGGTGDVVQTKTYLTTKYLVTITLIFTYTDKVLVDVTTQVANRRLDPNEK